ncbi:MAG: 5'-nucleotidase C-terminal domain-containing protein, partial [Anaerolineae bacterium]|nr:5'-nucleotidase C-terminal domain-containing protein [Anaerolineae bacterium]
HTNDTHTYHEPDAEGNGGVAIMKTVVDQIRAEEANSLLLDAGDRFTGTLFHAQYLGQDNAQIMNMLGYDALTLGNHEFDNGEDVLANFIDAVNFPVIAANVMVVDGSPLVGKVQAYIVKDFDGQQVGIIGMATPETRFLARPTENVTFDEDVVGITQAIVDELMAQGINKIILLAQLGYGVEMNLAPQLTGVDVMIGGDSESLLSNIYGAAGGRYTATVEGPYPTVVNSASGEPVLIVQAFRHNRFLGRLDVTFDANGVATDWGGDAIFMSRYIPANPEMQVFVEELRQPLEALLQQVIGQSSVFLVGDRDVCRVEECNLGNLVADAIRANTGAQIVIMNGGGIRANIPAAETMPSDLHYSEPHDVTLGDVLTAFPFRNRVSTFDLKGSDVSAALENGLARLGADNGTGRFPQVSGLRFSFDASKEVGGRVQSVEVLNANGEYEPIDPEAMYSVASIDFLREGGDEYTVFRDSAQNAFDAGPELDVVLADYIASNSPVNPQVEGRITRLDQP